MPAAVESRGDLAADEATERVADDGAAPALVEPAGLVDQKLGDVGPRGQQGLVEVEVVGDLTHQPGADGDGARRRLGVAPLRRHTDAVGGEVEPASDRRQDLGRPPLRQVAPVDASGAPELVRVLRRPLRDRE